MIVYQGSLLMNGSVIQWPPRDVNGRRIDLGSIVFVTTDTLNARRQRRFVVGALRLQNAGGTLEWIVCAFDDDDLYFEARTSDCVVVRSAPVVVDDG